MNKDKLKEIQALYNEKMKRKSVNAKNMSSKLQEIDKSLNYWVNNRKLRNQEKEVLSTPERKAHFKGLISEKQVKLRTSKDIKQAIWNNEIKGNTKALKSLKKT